MPGRSRAQSLLSWVLLALSVCAAPTLSAAQIRGWDAEHLELRVGGAHDDDVVVVVWPKPEKHDHRQCFPQQNCRVPTAGGSGRIMVELIGDQTDYLPWLHDDRVPFFDGKHWGFLDGKGNVAIQPQFKAGPSGLRPFSEGLAVVSDGTLCGYIDPKGAIVIPLRFKWAFDFWHGMGSVEDGDKWGVIRKDGSWLVEPQFKRADLLGGGIQIERADGSTGWCQPDGTITKTYDGK